MTRLDATANPTRLAIARHLADHPQSSAPEVAGGAGVHLNTARAHLSTLTEAGAVERIVERAGCRGRPSVRYRLKEGWVPDGDEFLSLSKLLGEAVAGSGADAVTLGKVAAHWGRRSRADVGPAPIEGQLTAALSRLGFDARVKDRRLLLSGCPCPVVMPDRPAVICALADAVVEGVLDGSELSAGAPQHDPKSRRCSRRLASV